MAQRRRSDRSLPHCSIPPLNSSPFNMSTHHLNLPPVPSSARIIQPVNKDTALILLQSVLKSGSHKPPYKWVTLVRLLWEMPPNQGPFYRVYREWSETGRSRNIRLIVDALLHHYGDFDPLKNPYPSTIQAMARRLSSKAVVMTLEDRQQCDANTCCVSARSLENNYQEGALGMLPEGTCVNAPQVHGASPLYQQQLQDACGILSQNPRSCNLHFHPIVCDDSSHPLVLPTVVPAVNADGVDDVNVAAGQALPHVNGAVLPTLPTEHAVLSSNQPVSPSTPRL
jgi:hypothetical protein